MDRTALKISVITVTYNSEDTLSGTIRSVLDQSFLPYEYIVIDGLSTDETLSVVESFREEFDKKNIKLTVVSEKDDGIYDAMNKGVKIASGDIVGIINSDDVYEKDALITVADAYEKTPFDLFYADIRMMLPDGRSFVKHSRDRRYATSRDWNHPTTFIARDIYDRYQYRTDNIHDDYDLILRIKKDGARTVIKVKYDIYRRNGYSRFYIIECVMVEAGKLVIG